jgi:hypothetical protein
MAALENIHAPDHDCGISLGVGEFGDHTLTPCLRAENTERQTSIINSAQDDVNDIPDIE